MSNEIFTVDDNNNAAIRTVSVKAGAVESNQPDIFTQDENGNAAVRVVGGGDQSNLGYFATPEALSEAYPTAEPGNWAIVGSTDTVWIWDADSGESGAWVDSDKKGQVTSVNNQTGAVTLGINDVAPTQTGQSGKFLTTDGTDASWGTISALQNTATGANSLAILGNTSSAQKAVGVGQMATADANGCVAVGYNSYSHNINALAIGYGSKAQSSYAIAIGSSATAKGFLGVNIGMGAGSGSSSDANQMCIGYYATATAKGAYQFGYGTNSEAGTVCFALNTNGSTSLADWHNYKLLDSDGTIPKERLTKVATVPSTMPTLAAASWSSNTQTVTVTGVTASNVVFVAPAPASAADYSAAGIVCTAQSADSLTFTCTTTPTNDIVVNVVIL